MADPILPPIKSNVISAPATVSPNTSTSSLAGATDKQTIAGNFQTFLTLLTTQLKNQNPLDPLDTNQFTAQLVQFAQVEQQIKQNDQLATLISLEKTAQSMTALAFVGATVAIDGQTAALSNGKAAWSFTAPKPVSATVTIRNAAGQTVYSTNLSMNAGAQNFVWDGRDASGTNGPTATTRSRLRPRTPAVGRRRYRPRSRASLTPSTSPRARRSSRSAGRSSPSTRSSGWCARSSLPRSAEAPSRLHESLRCRACDRIAPAVR